MKKIKYLTFVLLSLCLTSCSSFEEDLLRSESLSLINKAKKVTGVEKAKYSEVVNASFKTLNEASNLSITTKFYDRNYVEIAHLNAVYNINFSNKSTSSENQTIYTYSKKVVTSITYPDGITIVNSNICIEGQEFCQQASVSKKKGRENITEINNEVAFTNTALTFEDITEDVNVNSAFTFTSEQFLKLNTIYTFKSEKNKLVFDRGISNTTFYRYELNTKSKKINSITSPLFSVNPKLTNYLFETCFQTTINYKQSKIKFLTEKEVNSLK